MVDYTPTLIPLPAAGASQGVNPITTQAALKAQRDYANALLYGKGQQPVQHWTQGVSNMVSALMGGQLDYNAAQKERQLQGDFAREVKPDLGGPVNPVPQKMSFTDAPSGEGDTNTADGGEMAARKAATASIESGSPEGNYSAIGPVVKTGSYAGDRAYGKYQVMGKNLENWSKEIFGRVMTPEEFMKNPPAQEKMFEVKSTRDPRDWFGHGKSDGYMSGANYEKKYAEGLSKYGGGQPAMAFSGAPAEGGGPAAIAAAALRGGNAVPRREQAMPVGGNAPIIDPDTVPRQPKVTLESLQRVLANSYAPDAFKSAMFQLYLQQNQPITVPRTGGNVVVSPWDPTRQRDVGTVENPETKFGDITVRTPYEIGPDKKQHPFERAAPPAAAGPRSDAAPVAPATAPQGSPVPTPASVVAAAQPVPLPTPRPAGANPVASAPAPVQVASLDPAAGVGNAVEPPLTPREQEMMALVKPGAEATPAAPIVPPPPKQDEVAQAPATGPLSQVVAQNKAPALIPQDVWDAHLQNMQTKRENEVNQASQIENNKESAKRYNDLMGRVDSANEQRNNLATARQLMEDKNFYAGLGNGVVETWKRFKSALGIDPDASAPMEIFKKTTAQSIMAGMRTAFGGMGQIRNMEIRLQELANASLNNSPTAIKALLEISDRNAVKIQQLGEIASQYRAGREVVDPITGEVLLGASSGPRNGLDAEYDRIANAFQRKHPTFSEKEYANFAETLKGKVDSSEGNAAAGTNKAAAGEPPAGAIEALRANPGKREMFEKYWPGQADKYLQPTAPTSK